MKSGDFLHRGHWSSSISVIVYRICDILLVYCQENILNYMDVITKLFRLFMKSFISNNIPKIAVMYEDLMVFINFISSQSWFLWVWKDLMPFFLHKETKSLV